MNSPPPKQEGLKPAPVVGVQQGTLEPHIEERSLPDVGQPIETRGQAATRMQRWVMVIVSCSIFIVLNLVVVALVFYQLTVEDDAIAHSIIKASDRTITGGVFMALIGATVVETGYAIRTIMQNLFGRSDKS